MVEKMRMTAYKNFIAVEFKYFDLQEFLPKLYLGGVPLVGLVVKVEVEDGGDVAQASSQDAKADEGQGVTEMCNIK